jgi:hypothetical protein
MLLKDGLQLQQHVVLAFAGQCTGMRVQKYADAAEAQVMPFLEQVGTSNRDRAELFRARR